MNDEHEQGLPASRAPYAREQDLTNRADADPVRPWKEAGRSWAAQARRLDAYYRAHGTTGDKMRSRFAVFGHPEVFRLKARAEVARVTARKLDRLSAAGWIVLHDRRLVGTEETIDHIVIGPGGLTAVQSIDPEGKPPAGVLVDASVHVARIRLQQVTPAIVSALSERMVEGWNVTIFTLIAVNGATQQIDETPYVVPNQLTANLIENQPRKFSPMQVADLAMTLDDAFPFAPIGKEPR